MPSTRARKSECVLSLAPHTVVSLPSVALSKSLHQWLRDMRTELRAAQDTVVTQTWARLSCSQYLPVLLVFAMNYNRHVHVTFLHARDALEEAGAMRVA